MSLKREVYGIDKITSELIILETSVKINMPYEKVLYNKEYKIATDAVIDGASNLANDARKGVGAIENTVENGAKDIGNAMHHDNTNGYTATRTATTGTTTNGMNSTLWTWVILAVAALVIIGIVWYYASQNNHVE